MHPNGLLEISCPAKVNLALSVGAPRDNGLHPLASWMVAIDLSDTLTLEKASTSRFDIRPADDAQHSNDRSGQSGEPKRPRVMIDWPVERDLAYRAHRLLENRTGTALAVNLVLRKRIPAGAGLGGGSSNAAATLVGLNRLFGLGLSDRALISLSQRLGSDVGFLVGAVLGHTSALVTGLGDQVEPMPLEHAIHLVLIFPNCACPTDQVYAAFDRLGDHEPHREPDPSRIRGMIKQVPLTADQPCNDLVQAVYAVRPELRRIAEDLDQQLRVPVHVTGSGSTLYIIAPSAGACQELAIRAAAVTGLPAIATQTLAPKPQ